MLGGVRRVLLLSNSRPSVLTPSSLLRLRTMSSEPPTKKSKSENDGTWNAHTLNLEKALVKDSEGEFLTDLTTSSIQVLQGAGPKSDAILESMKLKTVSDLGTYKFYKVAKAISVLAETEGPSRPTGSTMNIDNILDKEYETKTLKEILESPLSCLQGLTSAADATLGELNIKTVQDLAKSKYFAWAEAITELGQYEETKTDSERKAEKLKKQLD